MIPGEIIVPADAPDLDANVGLETRTLVVANTGDRPIQVGSHFHFYEVNEALRFPRETARGFRLNIAAGTAVRFEPGDSREVGLVALTGAREVYGLNGKINGNLGRLASSIFSVLFIVATTLASPICNAQQMAGGSSRSGEESMISIAEVSANYTRYRRMIGKEIFVNPDLAMLCVGASAQEVEKAREKHGPHAHTAIMVYMNELAAKAFQSGSTVYPTGSVIVKHKTKLGYREQTSGDWITGNDKGVGGMIKRSQGFDSANGDWEYFYFEDANKVESGKINSCIRCHQSAKATDYVFGTWKRE